MIVNIIGNNIAQILNQRAAEAEDPDSYRKEKVDLLEKQSGRNRISGLLKGTYSLNLIEAIMVKEIFELENIDEVIIYQVKDAK